MICAVGTYIDLNIWGNEKKKYCFTLLYSLEFFLILVLSIDTCCVCASRKIKLINILSTLPIQSWSISSHDSICMMHKIASYFKFMGVSMPLDQFLCPFLGFICWLLYLWEIFVNVGIFCFVVYFDAFVMLWLSNQHLVSLLTCPSDHVNFILLILVLLSHLCSLLLILKITYEIPIDLPLLY